MNSAETRAILLEAFAKYRAKSYRDLLTLLGHPDCYEIEGPSGARYQLEVQGMCRVASCNLTLWDPVGPLFDVAFLGLAVSEKVLASPARTAVRVYSCLVRILLRCSSCRDWLAQCGPSLMDDYPRPASLR